MRLLFCIPTLVHGGSQRQLSYLASSLAGNGHEIHLAYTRGGPNLERMKSSGVVLHRLFNVGNHDPGIFLQLVKLILRLKPQIVQTWLLQMDVFGGMAARITGTPWVLSERSCAEMYPDTIKYKLRISVTASAAAVVSNSRGGIAYWKQQNRHPNCYVVPNGVPLDEIQGIMPEGLHNLGLPQGEKIILYAGRFEKEKNIGNLVLALSRAAREVPFIAVLCGTGPDRPAIERMVGKCGLSDRVLLPGDIPNVVSLMKRADAFVFVSVVEGCPNVVLEAMACGCPLVVSDIPAHREVLGDQCALMVDPSRPEDIADALHRTLSDPDEARIRCEAAKRKVAERSISSMTRHYEEVYRDVLRR